jgi:hypothetical protein
MFALPHPFWIVSDRDAILIERQTGLVITLIEQRGWPNNLDMPTCYFDITVYLGPIGRWRFWRAMLGGGNGIYRCGLAKEYSSLIEAGRDVARSLREIGLITEDSHRQLMRAARVG